jgi:hypothetical protein
VATRLRMCSASSLLAAVRNCCPRWRSSASIRAETSAKRPASEAMTRRFRHLSSSTASRVLSARNVVSSSPVWAATETESASVPGLVGVNMLAGTAFDSFAGTGCFSEFVILEHPFEGKCAGQGGGEYDGVAVGKPMGVGLIKMARG